MCDFLSDGVHHSASRYSGMNYRRNHQTMMKNQKTTTRKTMYHSQRQPCREDMLFMRRNVPARMLDVSVKASFWGTRNA